jgi:hypothetical protein
MKASVVEMEGLLRGKCVPAKMLVNESLAEYLVRQFDALHERADKAERERDELRAERDGAMDSALAVADAWVRRSKAAEAEIARRDAAAGEVIYQFDCGEGWQDVDQTDYERYINARGISTRKVYTAAPPAVLPPDVIYKAQHIASVLEMIGSFDSDDIDSDTVDSRFEVDGVDTGSDASITEYATKGAEIIRTLVLGAQQQKVVELPESFKQSNSDNRHVMFREDVIYALDAAGVKWEVKK